MMAFSVQPDSNDNSRNSVASSPLSDGFGGAADDLARRRRESDPFPGNPLYKMIAKYLLADAENRLLRQALETRNEALTAEQVARLAAEAKAEAMTRLAYYDHLTGLFNRRALDERYQAALTFSTTDTTRSGQHLAIGVIDLDGFKQINDTYGHDAGDAVLQAVGTCLRESLRTSDEVIMPEGSELQDFETASRPGGDEFVLLLTHTDEVAFAQRARALENDLNNLVVSYKGTDIHVRGSLAVVTCDPELSAAANMKRADAAMYARKTERKGGQVAEQEQEPAAAAKPIVYTYYHNY